MYIHVMHINQSLLSHHKTGLEANDKFDFLMISFYIVGQAWFKITQ